MQAAFATTASASAHRSGATRSSPSASSLNSEFSRISSSTLFLDEKTMIKPSLCLEASCKWAGKCRETCLLSGSRQPRAGAFSGGPAAPRWGAWAELSRAMVTPGAGPPGGTHRHHFFCSNLRSSNLIVWKFFQSLSQTRSRQRSFPFMTAL